MESQIANTESSSHSSDFDDTEILIGEQVIRMCIAVKQSFVCSSKTVITKL